jgi:hypothetical protein
MKKPNQKNTGIKNTTLLQKKKQVDEVIANAQAEYDKVIAEAETHIAASKKIIGDNGLVPVVQFTEEGLLSLLKQLYISGKERIQIANPQIIYEIQALTEQTQEAQEAQEVEYEVVEEKIISH